jgi:hypothetical protein
VVKDKFKNDDILSTPFGKKIPPVICGLRSPVEKNSRWNSALKYEPAERNLCV